MVFYIISKLWDNVSYHHNNGNVDNGPWHCLYIVEQLQQW